MRMKSAASRFFFQRRVTSEFKGHKTTGQQQSVRLPCLGTSATFRLPDSPRPVWIKSWWILAPKAEFMLLILIRFSSRETKPDVKQLFYTFAIGGLDTMHQGVSEIHTFSLVLSLLTKWQRTCCFQSKIPHVRLAKTPIWAEWDPQCREFRPYADYSQDFHQQLYRATRKQLQKQTSMV
jgi:hypothetical protein